MTDEHNAGAVPLLELAAIAEKLPHANECYGLTHCGLCEKPPWAFCHNAETEKFMHAFESGKCNCPRGELLAKLGELK